MKLNEILQETIIKFPSKKTTKDNTPSTIGDALHDVAVASYRDIHPYSTPPKIKQLKRYSSSAITRVIEPDINNLLAQPPFKSTIAGWDVDLWNTIDEQGKLNVQVQIYTFLNDERTQFSDKIERTFSIQVCDFISKAFGSLVNKIIPMGMGIKLILNTKANAKPSIEHTLTKILRDLGFSGLSKNTYALFFTDKTKDGYKTKIQGVSLPTNQQMRLLDRKLRLTFGDAYKNVKSDGEIEEIGTRFAPAGTTNIRITFGPTLLKNYRK